MRCLLPCVLTLLALTMPAMAQRGDRGNPQPEVWRDMQVPPAPPLAPAEALERFQVPEGFRVELVASEPLVEDPVAMDWDAAGRMWVVEMRGFMPNVDGEGEREPIGRIVVLEDTDGDGKMDRSTAFLEGLVMPRAVAVVEESGDETAVLVGEPPNLWLCRDTDGDLVADEKEVVYDSYGRQGPVEHTDNGLLRGIDNHLYNAKSDLRLRYNQGQLDAKRTAFRGQWGIAQDDLGRLYTNHNSTWLFCDLLPAHYFTRNNYYDTGQPLERIVRTNEVFTSRVNPGINRGYQDHMLREDGRLARVTAISGVAIYRGDRYPEQYHGAAFIPEPSGNALGCFTIDELGGGVELETEHLTWPDDQWGKRELLTSTDERFRPVSAYNGPDGCIYIVDMYRGILQHKVFVTTFLRKQILERGLDTPLGLGRIYRLVPEDDRTEGMETNLRDAPSRQLVRHLSHGNGWWRDTAQRLLVQRKDEAAIEPLKSLAVHGSKAVARIHALWTLEGMGAMDRATAVAALSDPNAGVRAHALRAGEALIGSDAEGVFADAAAKLAGDESHAVRLQAMLTLGELDGQGSQRQAANEAMLSLITRYADDGRMRAAFFSGLAGRELEALRALLSRELWAQRESGYGAVVEELAAIIWRRGKPERVAALLNTIGAETDRTAWRRVAMLDGILNAEDDPDPIELASRPAALDELTGSDHEPTAERAAKVADRVTIGADDEEDAADDEPAMDEAFARRLERGEVIYQATCMACHQGDGRGQAGMAPSLRGTEWVLGPPEVPIRIVLNGLTGQIEVDGRTWNLIMPGHRESPIMTDQHTADVLTYIRQSWGNDAPPVDPETVERIREQTADRTEPWTAEELRELMDR